MIKTSCTILETGESDETNDTKYLENFSKIFEKEYELDGKCFNFKYEDSVKQFKEQTAYFTLFYQMCSQLGWHPTTNSKNQPFGSNVPLDFFLSFCKDVYGDVLVQTISYF